MNVDQRAKEIEVQKGRWQKKYHTQKEAGTEDFHTLSGIPVAPVYTQLDIPEFDYLRDLGFPGDEPYTRGVYPTMYRGRSWTMRQLGGFATPEETNERLNFLLKEGATGVNLVFDYPTLRGYDSDDPKAVADTGKSGVAIDSLQDMETTFNGIPIDKVSASLVTCLSSSAISLLSMYFAAAEKRGIDLSSLPGTTQNDFLMDSAMNTAPEIIPPKHSFRISCDVIEFCVKNVPRWNPISYAGYNYREAGMTAVQEAASVISHAIACSKEMLRRGWEVDDFAPRLSFFFTAHNDLFEEVAKYRAARRVWYKVMKERFKAKNPRSYTLRFHVQTMGSSLTAQQPLNNIIRAAYQALAAVLGGAQSLHVDGYDEGLCIPTEQAAMVALRTQQILGYETNVMNTADPLGGSYYVEYLTNEMEKQIWEYMEKIDEEGGIVSATEKGWVHREISNSAYAYHKAIECGEMKVVGVNCFKVEEELPVEIFEVPETVEPQRAKLEKLRKERDYDKVKAALGKVREKCHQDENLMPWVMEAVKANATLGEITNIFREEFGIWRMPLI